MGKSNSTLSTLLSKTPTIEEHFTTPESIIPFQKSSLKTIRNNPKFILWKSELIFYLEKLPQDQLLLDTLSLLRNGFQTGFTDESDFRLLKAKLNLIAEHIDRYEVEEADILKKQAMKKGTIVKSTFDEYTLIKQVGSGGNGRVFSAENKNKEFVAMKFVEKNISTNKMRRFKNEVYFCERHSHKNIVEILDRGYVILDDKEYVFYVMPLYAKTLRQKISEKLSPEDALTIFIGLIEGLRYAHQNNTIHRDIKPENIMFRDNSLDPIICDFGIAHFAEEDLFTHIKTKMSDRMANFQYAAPEQRAKEIEATPQTDIYAAALILNEMFTSEIPQAAGYKTIASVAPEYKFMDDVFEQLFKQNAEERLYPEDRILSEMKVCAEKYKRELEKHRLESVIDTVISPEVFNAYVVSKEYVNESIVFTMNCELPEQWFLIISTGLGDYSAIVGYEPSKLKRVGRNAIGMPIRLHTSESTIKGIVENVMDWIPKANVKYSMHLKEVARQSQRRKEEERKAELELLERKTSISDLLQKI